LEKITCGGSVNTIKTWSAAKRSNQTLLEQWMMFVAFDDLGCIVRNDKVLPDQALLIRQLADFILQQQESRNASAVVKEWKGLTKLQNRQRAFYAPRTAHWAFKFNRRFEGLLNRKRVLDIDWM